MSNQLIQSSIRPELAQESSIHAEVPHPPTESPILEDSFRAELAANFVEQSRWGGESDSLAETFSYVRDTLIGDRIKQGDPDAANRAATEYTDMLLHDLLPIVESRDGIQRFQDARSLADLANAIWEPIAHDYQTHENFLDSMDDKTAAGYAGAVLLELQCLLLFDECIPNSSTSAHQDIVDLVEFVDMYPQVARGESGGVLLEKIEAIKASPDYRLKKLRTEALEMIGADKTKSQKELTEALEPEIKEALASTGLPEAAVIDIIEAWSSTTEEKTGKHLIRNIIALNSLARTPGYVESAYNDFNIRHFGRYIVDYTDKSMRHHLEEQLRSSMKGSHLPDDIYIMPKSDHNAAFSRELHFMADGISSKSYYEADGAEQVKQALDHHRASTGSPPTRLILGAHGHKNYMKFGTEIDDKPFVSKKTLITSGIVGDIEQTKPEEDIILLSCSTGKKGGIGEFLADQLGVVVYAPDETVISEMDPSGMPVFMRPEGKKPPLRKRYSKKLEDQDPDRMRIIKPKQ